MARPSRAGVDEILLRILSRCRKTLRARKSSTAEQEITSLSEVTNDQIGSSINRNLEPLKDI